MDDFNFTLRYAIERICHEEWIVKECKIDYFNLVFVLSGQAHYVLDGKSIILNKNEAILIPRGTTRYAEYSGNNTLHLHSFDFYCDRSLPDFPQHILTFTSASTLLTLFAEFHHSWLMTESFSLLKAKSLFFQILYEVYQGAFPRKENYHVTQMKRYIETNYTQVITMENLAKLTGLSTVYCGALFRKETGCSAIRYWHQVQVRKATFLLKEADMTVSQAAYEAGFDDLYYFSKTFKQIQGISPLQYRRQHS